MIQREIWPAPPQDEDSAPQSNIRGHLTRLGNSLRGILRSYQRQPFLQAFTRSNQESGRPYMHRRLGTKTNHNRSSSALPLELLRRPNLLAIQYCERSQTHSNPLSCTSHRLGDRVILHDAHEYHLRYQAPNPNHVESLNGSTESAKCM
jgi:hypothetical protein